MGLEKLKGFSTAKLVNSIQNGSKFFARAYNRSTWSSGKCKLKPISFHLTPVTLAIKKMTDAGEHLEKEGPHSPSMGGQTDTVTMEISMIFPSET